MNLSFIIWKNSKLPSEKKTARVWVYCAKAPNSKDCMLFAMY